MKIKMIKKLPRLITIPGLTKKDYRGLQSGKVVEASGEAEKYLGERGYIEIVKETKAKPKPYSGGDK